MNKKTTKKNSKNDSRDLAKKIAQEAYDTKADDIVILDLTKLSSFTDFFVIASGKSDRHVQAIANHIQSLSKRQRRVEGEAPSGLPVEGATRAPAIEGYREGHWILLDYGSVVAHIFYEETREFYGIEKFWGDAPQVKLQLK